MGMRRCNFVSKVGMHCMYLCAKFQALPDYKSQGFILCENRLRFGGEATLQNVHRKGVGLYKCFVRFWEKD